MNVDPLARGVARRYRRGIQGATRVEYSDGGNIDAMAVMKLLQPSVGPLVRLNFWHPVEGMPSTVAWDAVTPDDRMVTGRVVLHAAVLGNVVRSWGEVFLDSVERATPF